MHFCLINLMKLHVFIITVIAMCLLVSSCDEFNQTSPSIVHKQISESAYESSEEKSDTCEITCPYCGFKKIETLPTEVCQIKYTCENCKKELTPEGDDCCVFCTHSTHKCPSKQVE